MLDISRRRFLSLTATAPLAAGMIAAAGETRFTPITSETAREQGRYV
jgi:hypothetical protein